MTGRSIVFVAVPYQVYVLTHSTLAVGVLGIVQAVPQVIAGLYGGALADRFDRRTVLLVSKAVLALTSLALGLGALGLWTPLWFIYLVSGTAAGVSMVEHAARSATVPRLVPPRRLAPALQLVQVLFQASVVVGPALAGVVIGAVGLAWAYALDVAAFAFAAAAIWQLRPQPPTGVIPDLGWRVPVEALSYVWKSQILVGNFAADLAAMVFASPRALFPALALQVFRVGPEGLGLIYAAPGVGGLLGSVFSGWVGRVRRQGLTVIWAVVAWGLAIIGFGLAVRVFWLGLLLLAVAGAADMISAVFRHTILQQSVPDSLRGRMSALNSMVVTTGPRLGDLESGAVAALTSTSFAIVSGGAACLLAVAVVAALAPGFCRYRLEAAAVAGDPAVGPVL